MEFFTGILMMITAIAALIFFKGTLKKIGSHSENIVTTVINESNVDLTRRSMEAYQELVEEYGENFMTPQEIYNKMNKKKKYKKE